MKLISDAEYAFLQAADRLAKATADRVKAENQKRDFMRKWSAKVLKRDTGERAP